MPLTEEDYKDLQAEADAEPERFRSWDPSRQFRREYAVLHPDRVLPDPENHLHNQNEIEQLPTVTSSSSSAAASTQYEGIRIRPGARGRTSSADMHDTHLHRSETHRINGKSERHPTALERINTHRTQHFGTVGSRVSTRKDKKSWPKFGGGKPYPPSLPSREEYVVEFDGADDPLHAQNWPLRKKCVNPSLFCFQFS
jgi:DHA1 family multidrug resistance protein-like MFS transporter